MKTYHESTRSFFCILISLGLRLSSCFAGTTDGDADTGTLCNVPENPRGYVRDSLNLLNAGASRVAILDSLACIAINWDRNRGGAGALNAIMHLARDDEQIRKYLLRVIEDSETGSTVHWQACLRIVYVADARVRKFLLDRFEQTWDAEQPAKKARAQDYRVALVSLADRDFLNWLEEAMATGEPSDPSYGSLAQAADLIRMRLDVQSMLDLIRSDSTRVDRGGFIRLAHRYGASKVQLRAAVQECMQRFGYDQTRVALAGSLKNACAQLRLFTEQEAMALGLPGAGAGSVPESHVDVFPPWATRNHEKWVEFWGLDRIDSE